MKPTSVSLPITEEEFDNLVNRLVKKYKFPDSQLVAAVLANKIMHLPPEQATTTLEVLRDCIYKSMAYGVARTKTSKMQHKLQIEDLLKHLTANPNDQQALDNLQRAADEGSDYAREALAKLTGEDRPKIVSIVPDEKPLGNVETTG
jgi:hypothetical protein